MPFAQIGDIRLHYATQGGATLPCLVFSNSLGTDFGMWERQAAALARDFHVLRYDTRGHGASGCGQAPVSIERLGQDVIGLLDHLGIASAHFCGISMGGLVGQWLGIHAPRRLGKLVLANTAARIGTPDGWRDRAALVRREGMDAVADGAAARWFTEDFIQHRPDTVRRMIVGLRAQDAEGYAACCDALARCDLRDLVSGIAVPMLVVGGLYDPVTTVDDAQWLAAQVLHARLGMLPASHLSNIEADAAFTGAVRDFLLRFP